MDQIQAMRVFACVVASGSFTRAAHSLSLSRSAVTKHVQALEEVVRAKLLVRDTRSVALTAEGAACYVRLVRLLADVDAFHASIRALGAERATDMASGPAPGKAGNGRRASSEPGRAGPEP